MTLHFTSILFNKAKIENISFHFFKTIYFVFFLSKIFVEKVVNFITLSSVEKVLEKVWNSILWNEKHFRFVDSESLSKIKIIFCFCFLNFLLAKVILKVIYLFIFEHFDNRFHSK